MKDPTAQKIVELMDADQSFRQSEFGGEVSNAEWPASIISWTKEIGDMKVTVTVREWPIVDLSGWIFEWGDREVK